MSKWGFNMIKENGLYYVINTITHEKLSIGTPSKKDCEELLNNYKQQSNGNDKQ